jgi:hypothetical protein
MKRRRRLRRLGFAVAALVALAALRIALGKALGDWVFAREQQRFERDVGSLDPDRLAAPELAPSENSVPGIVDAVAALDLAESERQLLVCAARCDALDSVRLAELDALLLRQRAGLEALRRAAERPGSSFGPRPQLFHGQHVDVLPWFTGARLATVDGERGIALGQPVRFDAAVATLHGMTLALRREPISVFAILGGGVERFELDLIRLQVSRATDLAEIATLADRVDELARLPAGASVLHGEAVFALDMLRRTPVAPRSTASLRRRIEAILWPWSDGHVEAGYLAGMRDLVRYAGRPQVEWPPIATIVAARPGRLRALLDPTAPLDMFGPWLFPNLLDIVRKSQQLESAEQLAALALEVAARRNATGAWPESLSGLAAARPDAVAGESPVYRVESDGFATLVLPTARGMLERELASAPAGQEPARDRRLRLTRWRISPLAPPVS